MERRKLLAVLGASVPAGLAGCLGGGGDDDSNDNSTGNGDDSTGNGDDSTGNGSDVEATIEVTTVSTNAPVIGGETIEITAAVENTGETEGTQAVTLVVDGAEQESTDVQLGPGETATQSFSVETDPADAGSTLGVAVEAGESSRSVSLDIRSDADIRASLGDATATVGETVGVTLDVTSVDDEADDISAYTIVIAYDDEVLELIGISDGTFSPVAQNTPTQTTAAITAFNASASTPATPAVTFEFEVVGAGTTQVTFDDSQPGGAGTNTINDGAGDPYTVLFEPGTVTAQEGMGRSR